MAQQLGSPHGLDRAHTALQSMHLTSSQQLQTQTSVELHGAFASNSGNRLLSLAVLCNTLFPIHPGAESQQRARPTRIETNCGLKLNFRNNLFFTTLCLGIIQCMTKITSMSIKLENHSNYTLSDKKLLLQNPFLKLQIIIMPLEYILLFFILFFPHTIF